MTKTRKHYTPQFKAKLAIEALKEERTVAEIALDNNLNPNILRRWRDELIANAENAFDTPKQIKDQKRREEALEAERAELLKAVGTATVERDWLRRVYKGLSAGAEPPQLGQVG